MAKVTAPLMSMSASGAFGKTIVFLKTGIAREYVVPANPQSVGQMAVRNVLKDIQAELKVLGTKLRGELKSQFGARWNSMIIGELMANENAVLLASAAEYSAFQAGEKTAWEGADTIEPTVRTQGELLYVVATAVYDIASRLGATITLTLPENDTAVATAAEWVAAAA